MILSPGGRSGSTTALDMVNGLPNMALDGEHDGIFDDFLNLEKKFKTIIGHNNGEAWTHSKYFKLTELYCTIQRWFLLHTGADCSSTSIHGFKEIRYSSGEMLDFITRVFPNSLIIFNYRREFTDNKDIPELKHMWVDVKKEEKKKNEMAKWALRNAEKVFELPMEDYDLQLFAYMSKFLGFPNCTPLTIMHKNGNRTISRKSHDEEIWNCSGWG